MADEFRTITITEVDTTKRAVKGIDQFGQLMAIANYFLQPITTVPQINEKWLVYQQGGQWMLDRRWDGDDKFMGLEAGDVHINAKNNLIIEAEKVLINGNEIDSSISVKQDNDEFSTGSIRFKDSDSIKFSIIPDGDSVDVYSRIITEPLTDPIATYDTAFPTDPVDGQEFTLVSSTTSSTYYWRFRYNASSTQTYLWEFVGGTVFNSTVASVTQSTTASMADLAGGPTFTAPVTGQYLVTCGCTITGVPSAAFIAGMTDNTTGSPTARWAFGTSANTISWAITLSGVRTLKVADVVKLRIQRTAGGDNSYGFTQPYINVTPIRLAALRQDQMERELRLTAS